MLPVFSFSSFIRNKNQEMPHSINTGLILGIMVGTTSVSLLLLWYHKIRKPRIAVNLPKLLSWDSLLDSMTSQDELCNGHGPAVVFQGSQRQTLEKLNELLINLEELKEEIRFLREAISKLEGCVRSELGRKVAVHRASPQHRARKRRVATGQSAAARSNSSEEAESEGGCCHGDQQFHLHSIEEQILADRQHHRATSVSHSSAPPGYLAVHPLETHRVSSSERSHSFPKQPNASPHPSFFGRKHSLFSKCRKSHPSLYKQPSRVNFDSQISFNNLNSSTNLYGARNQSVYTAPRLSIISCYHSATLFDIHPTHSKHFAVNEIGVFSRVPDTAKTQKYARFTNPLCNRQPFMNPETRDTSAFGSIDETAYCQNTGVLFSYPIVSSLNSGNNIATNIQEHRQLSKDPTGSLYSDSQRHHPSDSSLSEAFSSVCKCNGWFTPGQSAITLSTFEDGNVADSPGHECSYPPMEIPKTRYVTANTDTEEQGFPVPQALNTHAEKLNLEALLQKADHLRTAESGKVESFELLCDHKEKFKEEIEFIWRLTRAYADMYDLSTNTQEKKHYANIGKTLGEKAVNKAPMNGYCHMWLAILCGYVSEFEGLQNKVNYGHRFKEHLEKAIQLLPEEPHLYYLKGRYCYTVSKLNWIEKKMAITLFGRVPTSTIGEALYNFLKAEELHPGYSKSNYFYLAKCCLDLNKKKDALEFCKLGLSLSSVTKEDKEIQKAIENIITSLKR
ncbi:regulator of microtubule dynamics protein 2 isoform X1 [Echinops telfairi]|uniref:Regulator of microtubule dynamics protein 2 isoform X1 n=1 Tax=Echinops telfairi TaxID=9371 RepID=A0AC55CU22_ECHTE|nr:regulator of microtubule dynamics protein 2 isoform X1 [Echinops telfairi]